MEVDLRMHLEGGSQSAYGLQRLENSKVDLLSMLTCKREDVTVALE